jgi:phosphomannomutase
LSDPRRDDYLAIVEGPGAVVAQRANKEDSAMTVQNAGNIEKIKKRDDFRGKYPAHLNEDVAYHLGWALMETVFGQAGSGASAKADVAVGWDARLSSPALARGLMLGLSEHGAQVHSVGQCSSEMLYFAVGSRESMAGGVMITASHNPKDENGFKIVKRGAESISGTELNAIADQTAELLKRDVHPACSLPVGEEYADRVIRESGIRRQADGARLRVLVEAGNGVGALAFREVARKLPYLDVVYFNDEPNGEFPVCLPNPVKPEYMGMVRKQVLDEKADLGLAFDGDGDRVGVVDSQGDVLTPSEVMALIVERLLPDKDPPGKPPEHPDKEIMYNLTCSRLVPEVVNKRKAIPLMTPVGHGQIKPVLRAHSTEEYRKKTGRTCVFAGEHSGHYFFPSFYYADSGTTAGLMIIEQVLRLKEQGRQLHESIREWRETYFAIPETNFDMRLPDPSISEAEQQELLDKAVGAAQQYGTKLGGKPVERYDAAPDPPGTEVRWPSLKMTFEDNGYDWWFCVRPSGNEPLLRLNLEVILGDDGKKAGKNGAELLEQRFNELVEVIGPQYREKK